MKHNLYMYIFVMAAVTLFVYSPLIGHLSDPHAATDADQERDQKYFYKIFFILCTLCNSGCYDLSGYSDSHRQYLVCRHWFCDCTDSCMEQKKSDLCFPFFMCRRISC